MTEWMSVMPSREPNAPDLPEHLGGHYGYTNMDRLTFDYLVRRYGVRTMLDVGCGPGGMVDYARSRGVEAVGVDGDPHMAREDVITHDFTTGPLGCAPVDLIWCVEFVEHVVEEATLAFRETFKAARVLFMTHAQPGQGGHHHVNLQSDEYWIALLEHDWRIDYEATGWVRVHSGCAPYIKGNALVFTRRV